MDCIWYDQWVYRGLRSDESEGELWPHSATAYDMER